MQGLFTVQTGEFDPAPLGKKGGNFGGLLESGEKDRDNREIRIAGSPIEGHQHLLAVPGTEALRADEDRAGAAIPEPSLQLRLPEPAWDEAPLVEEGGDLLRDELPGKLLHRRFVGGAVAEEDVVAERHGWSRYG